MDEDKLQGVDTHAARDQAITKAPPSKVAQRLLRSTGDGSPSQAAANMAIKAKNTTGAGLTIPGMGAADAVHRASRSDASGNGRTSNTVPPPAQQPPSGPTSPVTGALPARPLGLGQPMTNAAPGAGAHAPMPGPPSLSSAPSVQRRQGRRMSTLSSASYATAGMTAGTDSGFTRVGRASILHGDVAVAAAAAAAAAAHHAQQQQPAAAQPGAYPPAGPHMAAGPNHHHDMQQQQQIAALTQGLNTLMNEVKKITRNQEAMVNNLQKIQEGSELPSVLPSAFYSRTAPLTNTARAFANVIKVARLRQKEVEADLYQTRLGQISNPKERARARWLMAITKVQLKLARDRARGDRLTRQQRKFMAGPHV